MDDTISRRAALEALNKLDVSDGVGISSIACGLQEEAIRSIENLPPAQPEIIRCKDCKHFAGEGMYCACDIIVHYDNFYCYYAERRTDE